jgi:hypothetical protein
MSCRRRWVIGLLCTLASPLGCGQVAASNDAGGGRQGSRDAGDFRAATDGAADSVVRDSFSVDAPALIDASCPAPIDGGTFQTVPGSGTIVGRGLSCVICNIDVSLQAESGDLGQTFNTFTIDSNTDGTLHCESPSAAFDLAVYGNVELSAASPGAYQGSFANATCGEGFSFNYTLPAPPGIQCGDAAPATPNSCPPLCEAVGCNDGHDGPCSSCQPAGPFYSYSFADGDGACMDAGAGGGGPWKLTLSSVVAFGSQDGETAYAVHGTFDVTLVGGDESAADAGTEPVTLSLSF